MSIIEVKDLHKSYGTKKVLKGVSLELESGQILGLVGQNGAGKTTLFRIILDLQQKDRGIIKYNGQDFRPSFLKRVGYLPEERGLYNNLTIEEQVVYFGRLKGLNKGYVTQVLDSWLERFEVKGTRKTKIKTLSKGNAQKVMVITTLIHILGEGDVIICDEPFSGLDVVNQDLLARELLRLKKQGVAIIFSSHNMANTEMLCDDVIMLHNGEFKVSGTIQNVKESFGRHKLIIEGSPLTLDEIKQLPGIEQVKIISDKHYQLTLTEPEYGDLLYDDITQGQYIPQYRHEYYNLEEIFTQIVGGR